MCRIFAVMAIRAVPPRSAADRTTRRPAATVDRIDAMDPLIAYLPNPFFVAKMLLYIAIATLSIKPTTSFIRWRRRLHAEVALLALIPLMTVLMARGIGR